MGFKEYKNGNEVWVNQINTQYDVAFDSGNIGKDVKLTYTAQTGLLAMDSWENTVMISNDSGETWNSTPLGTPPTASFEYNYESHSYGNDILYMTASYYSEGIRAVEPLNSFEWVTVPAAFRSSQYGFPTAIAFGNSKFVAIHPGAAAVSTSTDAITWTQHSVSTTWKNINDIGFVNDRFVAVSYGFSDAPSTIPIIVGYSTNGTSWTQTTINTTLQSYANRPWNRGSFAYAPDTGKYLVTLQGRVNCLVYSTNGTSWQTVVVNDTWPEAAIGYGDKFLVVGQSGFAYTTTDGTSFTLINYGLSDTSIESLHYMNGYYFATGQYSSKLWRSADGITWSYFSLPKNNDNYAGTAKLTNIKAITSKTLDDILKEIR